MVTDAAVKLFGVFSAATSISSHSSSVSGAVSTGKLMALSMLAVIIVPGGVRAEIDRPNDAGHEMVG